MLGLGVLPAALNIDKRAGVLPDANPDSDREYHLAVFGGTPGGIALTVRAAREGLKVVLINHNQHLGGMFVNGLGTMDTLYNGARAPIYDELRYMTHDYYREKYGKQSPQYKASLPGFPKTRFESNVMEKLINDLLEKENLITVIKDYYPVKVYRAGKLIDTVIFSNKNEVDTITIEADVFADCSYEGDLAVVANTPMRIGRESKAEFNEAHAGVVYMTKDAWPPSSKAMNHMDLGMARRMNLFVYNVCSDLIKPESTGASHEAIQAFNMRTTLTDDSSNRIAIKKPTNYEADHIKAAFGITNDAGLSLPNQKTSWNLPELMGEQNNYVLGNWKVRDRITKKFRDMTLAYLYFLQHDPSVPEAIRNKMLKFGLAGNEYMDNGNMPYEIYVREAWRLEGRAVFTEHNALLSKGIKRAPIQTDSISVTEWFMDAHACRGLTLPGSKPEGEIMLKNKTFPGQVSCDCIFPKDIDNLIVPVCLSSSHVGWGTIRLEPTWMSICEAAGHIVVMAIQNKVAPAQVNKDKLLQLLASKALMITFFNDVEGREYAPWYPAVQYLGTKGFFGSYNAKPHDLLTRALASAWLDHTARLAKNPLLDPMKYAAGIFSRENLKSDGITGADFSKMLSESNDRSPRKILAVMRSLKINPKTMITRGDACRVIFEVLKA